MGLLPRDSVHFSGALLLGALLGAAAVALLRRSTGSGDLSRWLPRGG